MGQGPWLLDYETVGLRSDRATVIAEVDLMRPKWRDEGRKCDECEKYLTGCQPNERLKNAGKPGFDDEGFPIRPFTPDPLFSCSGCIVGMIDDMSEPLRVVRGNPFFPREEWETTQAQKGGEILHAGGRPPCHERKRIEAALSEFPRRSDRKIAVEVGVDAKTVGNVRRAMGVEKLQTRMAIGPNADSAQTPPMHMRGPIPDDGSSPEEIEEAADIWLGHHDGPGTRRDTKHADLSAEQIRRRHRNLPTYPFGSGIEFFDTEGTMWGQREGQE